MTCFWDETLKGLSYFAEFKEFEEYNIISRNGGKNRKNYIDFCKKNCDILLEKYKNVIWEGFEKNERDKVDENGIDLNDSSIREQEIKGCIFF